MGAKYMAECATYPYQGSWEFDIREQRLLPFLIKVFKAAKKYQIIDIHFRDLAKIHKKRR